MHNTRETCRHKQGRTENTRHGQALVRVLFFTPVPVGTYKFLHHQLDAEHDTETLLYLVSYALHSAYRGVGFVLWFYLQVEDPSIQASTGAFHIIFILKLTYLNLVEPPRWLLGKAPALGTPS